MIVTGHAAWQRDMTRTSTPRPCFPAATPTPPSVVLEAATMKKSILLCGVLLALTASVASAGPGVNLRWTNCFGDAGQSNRAFACSTNAPITANNILVCSFELAADVLAASGNE